LSSRSAGKTIQQLAPPSGEGPILWTREIREVRQGFYEVEAKCTLDVITRELAAPGNPVFSVTVTGPGTTSTLDFLQLTATVRDQSNNVLLGRIISWATSNKAIATVGPGGLVVGVSPGTVTIFAYSEGVAGSISVTILVPVATVTIAPSSFNMFVGGTQQLTATQRDASNNILSGRPITWSTSDPTVATVDSNGLVTGVAAPGTCTITATSDTPGISGTASATVSTNRPPDDVAHLWWYWDPAQSGAAQAVVGPTGTVTGAVQTQGPPGYYTFATANNIDFGDSGDAAWTNSAGWTLYMCVWPQAGDLGTGPNNIVSKDAQGAGTREIDSTNTANGKIRANVMYGGNQTNWEQWNSTNVEMVAGTKYVIAITFDPTQTRPNRIKVYKNGSLVTGSASNIGSDGTVSDTTAALRIGHPAGASGTAFTRIGAVAGYSGSVHNLTQIGDNTTFFQTLKGWT